MQNRISDQPAFILHRRDYQDSSLILELFTQDYGRLSLLARGARKRRDVGNFQLFNRLSVSWSGRAELKTLTHIDSRPSSLSPACYMAAIYINELLLNLLPKQDENRALFQQYQALMLQLNEVNMQILLRNFEFELLTGMGLMPNLCYESASGLPVQADRNYCVDVLSGVRPGIEGDDIIFSGRELTGVQQQRFESSAILLAARRLMRQIIDYNLQGRTLQSRKIFQQLTMKK